MDNGAPHMKKGSVCRRALFLNGKDRATTQDALFMQQRKLTLPMMTLIGTEIRTNNIFETTPTTSKIGPCVHHYMQEQLFNKITNRKNPNRGLYIFHW